MQQLTLKDFILNTKCLNCNISSSIIVIITNKESLVSTEIKTIFNKNFLEANFKISYKNSLNIKIYYKNNKFETNNFLDLTEFFKKFTVSLFARCNHCSTRSYTEDLLFNLNKNYLSPFKIKKESIDIFKDDTLYVLVSNYKDNSSRLLIDKLSKFSKHNVLKLSLPLIKRSSFKSKEHFIEKINKIILFS
jgi:hypothetical protein